MVTSYKHIPVMCEEVLTALAPAVEASASSCRVPVVVDATLGLGGHASAVLERFPEARLVGIDRDPQALSIAEDRLRRHRGRYEVHQATYDAIAQQVAEQSVAAVVFDLGLSSLQIDTPERGFAYSTDTALTMRMDGDTEALTAADVVNTYSEEALARLFRVFGDEKYAGRIARAIVAERERALFDTSARLTATIAGAIPVAEPRPGHPAKRVFQALRMEVNDERSLLQSALPAALRAVSVGGRVVVLSYHSGEDRLVKQTFARASEDHVPPGLAVVPTRYQAQFRLVTRGVSKATPAEVAINPRSQSARLRVIERVKEMI